MNFRTFLPRISMASAEEERNTLHFCLHCDIDKEASFRHLQEALISPDFKRISAYGKYIQPTMAQPDSSTAFLFLLILFDIDTPFTSFPLISASR